MPSAPPRTAHVTSSPRPTQLLRPRAESAYAILSMPASNPLKDQLDCRRHDCRQSLDKRAVAAHAFTAGAARDRKTSAHPRALGRAQLAGGTDKPLPLRAHFIVGARGQSCAHLWRCASRLAPSSRLSHGLSATTLERVADDCKERTGPKPSTRASLSLDASLTLQASHFVQSLPRGSRPRVNRQAVPRRHASEPATHRQAHAFAHLR